MKRWFYSLIPVLAVLSGCGGANTCRCDLIAAESRCIQFTASDSPLYATGVVTYTETLHWYRTGGDPVDPQDPSLDDDCGGGTVTRY
jgi:hypothetical protein